MIWIAAFVLALGALYGVEVLLHRTSGDERALLARAPAAARAAGCSAVRLTRPFPGGRDRVHIGAQVAAMPPLSEYPSVPPASGPHAPITLGAGVYRSPPPIDRAIHSLEHAAAIVWLAPDEERSRDAAPIEAFFARGSERNHVIVAPYDYPAGGAAGRLPAGVGIALVAWHHVQTCARPDLAVAFAFVHAYRFDLWQPTAYRGDAPEKFTPI